MKLNTLVILLCLGCTSGTKAPVTHRTIPGKASKPCAGPVVRTEFTKAELEEMASHEPRSGMGMNFYYDELRRRNDAKWAKEQLQKKGE